MIFTENGRKVLLILSVIAEIICCGLLNLMGAYAFIVNEYLNCGYALIISSVLLISALFFAAFRKVIIPLILNIFGSAGYIYALSVLSSIPSTKIPAENTEKLMANHYPTIAVTVLLVLLILFNFMSKDAVEKRRSKKLAKIKELNRSLTDDEKII